MKKNKTSLGISSISAFQDTNGSKYEENNSIQKMQKRSKQSDYQLLIRKNQLLIKQLQMTKQSKKCMQKQLQSYRKIVFKNSDIHEILQMQHQNIFELQTKLQVLQNKYDKLLSLNGSQQQTQYALKCRQLESIIKSKQIQHQKQISTLKAKMMRINASQIVQNRNSSANTTTNSINMGMNGLNYSGYMSMNSNSLSGINSNGVTVLKNNRKLV